MASEKDSEELNTLLPRLYPENPGDPLIQSVDIATLYKNGGYKFEHALFIKRLSLSGKRLNGKMIDDQMVLNLLNKVSKITDSVKIDYLIQRIYMEDSFDNIARRDSLFIQAMNILKHGRLDNNLKTSCVELKTCALKCNSHPGTDSVISPNIILEDIESITNPATSAKLKFFFLAECYLEDWKINDVHIEKSSILVRLKDIPVISMRTALIKWLNEEIRFRQSNNPEPGYFTEVRHDSLDERQYDYLQTVKSPSVDSVSAATKNRHSQPLDSESRKSDSDSGSETEFFDACNDELFKDQDYIQNSNNMKTCRNTKNETRDHSISTEYVITDNDNSDTQDQATEEIKHPSEAKLPLVVGLNFIPMPTSNKS